MGRQSFLGKRLVLFKFENLQDVNYDVDTSTFTDLLDANIIFYFCAMKGFLKFVSNKNLLLVFLVSGIATFGSMYLSVVLELPTCDLCWYQRIFMYPIFVITATSLSFEERISNKFILALAIPGALIAGYHYILQKFPNPNLFVPCTGGVSCSAIEWTLGKSLELPILDFVTIPFMSLVAFSFVIALVGMKVVANRRLGK